VTALDEREEYILGISPGSFERSSGNTLSWNAGGIRYTKYMTIAGYSQSMHLYLLE